MLPNAHNDHQRTRSKSTSIKKIAPVIVSKVSSKQSVEKKSNSTLQIHSSVFPDDSHTNSIIHSRTLLPLSIYVAKVNSSVHPKNNYDSVRKENNFNFCFLFIF